MSKEYRVSYEQYIVVEADSAQEAVDFVHDNLVKPTINSQDKGYYLTESISIGFDDESGDEYMRDDYNV